MNNKNYKINFTAKTITISKNFCKLAQNPANEEYNLLVSYYINGDSIDKIAKEMDKSKAAAFKRIYRIKSRIMQYMHETHKE